MTTLPISAFIICVNEAARIEATLQSLKGLVDEIVIVDSGSTDGTQEIAARYGRVLHHDWPGYGLQKRFAEDQCQHDWVLNLDADEVLSEALTEEIRTAFSAETTPEGYAVLIRDCLPGEAQPRRFAHTTKAVRLYRKSKGRYADSTVHDRVKFNDAEAPIQTLRAPVYHYSSVSLTQVIAKLNRYSSMQADDAKQRGKSMRYLGLRVVTEFPIAFLKSYILRGDILRGQSGYINATTYAFSRFARVVKMWENESMLHHRMVNSDLENPQ